MRGLSCKHSYLFFIFHLCVLLGNVYLFNLHFVLRVTQCTACYYTAGLNVVNNVGKGNFDRNVGNWPGATSILDFLYMSIQFEFKSQSNSKCTQLLFHGN